jgi:hypothetical protein
MTIKEAIMILNANVVFACGRAGFDSTTVKMVEDALDTIEDALKAQEPRLVTEADFENADPYGYLPVWVEDKDDSEIICDCITKYAITEPDEDYHYRFWTSRPDEKRRAETPWE